MGRLAPGRRATGPYPRRSGRPSVATRNDRVASEVSTMQVRSIYRPWVVTADGDERLDDVAARMQDNQVGSLVVTAGGRP